MMRFWIALSVSLLLGAHAALAQELRVLTSFPPKVSNAFAALWRERDPATEIRVLNKNTVAGIDEILRGNERHFDVFWATAPEAFEILKRSDSFADEAVCGEDGPAPIEPFALSSVGWARRKDSALYMPADWNDLLRPIYRDKIAMARPARSGTTHMLVEKLLLLRGWEDGWAYLLELAGNLSTLTARSYGVPDGLENERFKIGLTIDFLSQSRGEALQFRYGRPIVLVAAQVGVLRNGARTEKACDFVRMLLSREGQLTLMSPEISRIPYDASIRAEVASRLPKDIMEALQLSWFDYDAETSADRYWAVNTLFDVMITERLVERRELWRRFHALRGSVSRSELQPIRGMLTTVMISEDDAVAASRRTEGALRSTALAAPGDAERELARKWRSEAAALMNQAGDALSLLEQRVAE